MINLVTARQPRWVGLVRHGDKDGSGCAGNPDELGRPDDPDKPNQPDDIQASHACQVRQSGLTRPI